MPSVADLIRPERAVIYALPVTQYDEIVGGELLTGDPYDPAYWTPVNGAIVTRQAGVYLGGDAIRVAYSANGTPMVKKAGLLLAGHRYRTSAAMQRNVGASYGFLNVGNNVEAMRTTSLTFAQLRNDATQAGDLLFYLGGSGMGAGGYVDFAALSLKELRRVVKNHGRAVVNGVQAPSVIVCGDGWTSTKFPGMKQPRGMVFDGGDFLQVPHIEMPNLGNNFTLAVLCYVTGTDSVGIISKSSGGLETTSPYDLWFQGSGNRFLFYNGNGAAANTVLGTNGIGRGVTRFVAGIATTTGLQLVVDKIASAVVARTVNSVNNALPFIIGGMNTSGGFLLNGSRVLGVAIYPYALSQQSLRALEAEMRRDAQIY